MHRIALLGAFVGRGKERQVGEICAAQGAFYTLAAPATGTAASEVLQVLGIGEISRTLVLSLVPEPLLPHLRQEIRDRLFMTQPGQGILFTVPLSGINARLPGGSAGGRREKLWRGVNRLWQKQTLN